MQCITAQYLPPKGRSSKSDGAGALAKPLPVVRPFWSVWNQPPRVRHEGFHHGSSYLEHLDFLAAVRGGARPTVGLDDGLWSVAAGVAAHRSIDEGRPVPLAEVLGED